MILIYENVALPDKINQVFSKNTPRTLNLRNIPNLWMHLSKMLGKKGKKTVVVRGGCC